MPWENKCTNDKCGPLKAALVVGESKLYYILQKIIVKARKPLVHVHIPEVSIAVELDFHTTFQSHLIAG